jgi:hypothetical protein
VTQERLDSRLVRETRKTRKARLESRERQERLDSSLVIDMSDKRD